MCSASHISCSEHISYISRNRNLQAEVIGALQVALTSRGGGGSHTTNRDSDWRQIAGLLFGICSIVVHYYLTIGLTGVIDTAYIYTYYGSVIGFALLYLRNTGWIPRSARFDLIIPFISGMPLGVLLMLLYSSGIFWLFHLIILLLVTTGAVNLMTPEGTKSSTIMSFAGFLTIVWSTIAAGFPVDSSEPWLLSFVGSSTWLIFGCVYVLAEIKQRHLLAMFLTFSCALQAIYTFPSFISSTDKLIIPLMFSLYYVPLFYLILDSMRQTTDISAGWHNV